jgi:hypothetical protein
MPGEKKLLAAPPVLMGLLGKLRRIVLGRIISILGCLGTLKQFGLTGILRNRTKG